MKMPFGKGKPGSKSTGKKEANNSDKENSLSKDESALKEVFQFLTCTISFFGSILPPPPSVFYDTQLQIICCYITRYYVKR